MYHDYAAKQQMKLDRQGGGGMGRLFGAGCVGFVLSKLHSGRAMKKLKSKHKKEVKQLYTQYYNDIYKMQDALTEYAQTAEHYKNYAVEVAENAELDAMQRDYDEFKQPDVDGDDRISRAEFNHYVKTYLANYPGLSEKDYPRFEDFDHDRDGYVSFAEYSQQMAAQVQQAEWEAQLQAQTGGGNSGQERAQALAGLYGQSQSNPSDIHDLYARYR